MANMETEKVSKSTQKNYVQGVKIKSDKHHWQVLNTKLPMSTSEKEGFIKNTFRTPRSSLDSNVLNFPIKANF